MVADDAIMTSRGESPASTDRRLGRPGHTSERTTGITARHPRTLVWCLTAYYMCITMHHMSQTSFRLPQNLLRALTRAAHDRKVPKSQIVREAIEQYLAQPEPVQPIMTVRERSAPYVGAVRLDRATSDAVASRIRAHNWRD